MWRFFISIHALHEESDQMATLMSSTQLKFQSTLSMRRATLRRRYRAGYRAISIHALHEESDVRNQQIDRPKFDISIHALHEESDSRRYCLILHRGYISIHALHEESDLSNQQAMQLADIFQSTLSMRRATATWPTPATPSGSNDFNPRSP